MTVTSPTSMGLAPSLLGSVTVLEAFASTWRTASTESTGSTDADGTGLPDSSSVTVPLTVWAAPPRAATPTSRRGQALPELTPP
jgi:hypothetical protein